MSNVLDRSNRQKTLEIARRYKAKGYVVRSALTGQFVQSEKIRGYRPDIVAQKGRKFIIVEVKTRPSLKKESRALKEFSRHVHANPNYTFELVVTNPQFDSKPINPRARAAAAKMARKKAAKKKRSSQMSRSASRTLARSRSTSRKRSAKARKPRSKGKRK